MCVKWIKVPCLYPLQAPSSGQGSKTKTPTRWWNAPKCNRGVHQISNPHKMVLSEQPEHRSLPKSLSWHGRLAVGSTKVAAHVEQHVLDKAGDKRRRRPTTRTEHSVTLRQVSDGDDADTTHTLTWNGKVCLQKTRREWFQKSNILVFQIWTRFLPRELWAKRTSSERSEDDPLSPREVFLIRNMSCKRSLTISRSI